MRHLHWECLNQAELSVLNLLIVAMVILVEIYIVYFKRKGMCPEPFFPPQPFPGPFSTQVNNSSNNLCGFRFLPACFSHELVSAQLMSDI